MESEDWDQKQAEAEMKMRLLRSVVTNIIWPMLQGVFYGLVGLVLIFFLLRECAGP